MKLYQSKIPSCTYGGQGSLNQVAGILSAEKAQRVIVFTDQGVRGAGLLDPLTDLLQNAGVPYTVFDQLKAEPSYQDVDALMQQVGQETGSLIIALGGGSVMDTAKLCAALQGAPYTTKDLLGSPGKAKKQMKSIMIPTTCGTGSEATCNAIVAVPEDGVKVGIVNDCLIPDYVILDPEMIRGLPAPIIAATGVDALAHAVECYTSLKANPLSDVYAMASAKLIFQNIRAAYSQPEHMEAKSNMLIGAFYGGAAITASGTTAVHALSYPLGGKYHIAHGVSNAILFAHVMAFNKDACEGRLAQICDAIHPDLCGQPKAERARFVIDEIADIVRFTNIPTNLAQYGVTAADLDFLTDAGSKVTRLLDNNCKKLSLDDIRAIYRKVL